MMKMGGIGKNRYQINKGFIEHKLCAKYVHSFSHFVTAYKVFLDGCDQSIAERVINADTAILPKPMVMAYHLCNEHK